MAMNPELIKFDDLCEFTGLSEPHQVRKWLDDNGVKQYQAAGKRGRPCTTLKALNAALGLEVQPETDAPTIIRSVEL